MKEGFYFPHFSNARNDEKIIKLRRVMGIEGSGMYFLLLEVLREQTEFKMPVDALEDLAYDWHTSKEKLAAVVSNFELFQVDDKYFFSPKFNDNMQPYIEGKEKKRIGGIKGNLIKSAIITKAQASKMSAEELDAIDQKRKQGTLCLPSQTDKVTYSHRETHSEQDSEQDSERLPLRSASQMKENEMKENEMKENNIAHFDNESTCFSFIEFWDTYKKKVGRKRSEEKYKKLSEADRQKIKDTLEAYVQSTEVQFRKDPHTYINGEHWNDEIIQNEYKKQEEYKPRKLKRLEE